MRKYNAIGRAASVLLVGIVLCGCTAFAEGVDLKVEFKEKGPWTSGS